MKKMMLLLLFILSLSQLTYSQTDIKAVTEQGKSVILHSDGTWEYDTKMGSVVSGAAGIIISERTGMPLETLKEVVITNAKKVASTVTILFEELRNVNGVEVLHLKLDLMAKGIPFIFYGYYYSSDLGSFQVTTYTAKNLFDEYESDFLNFLNGMTITE
jgi:hypothetical protein